MELFKSRAGFWYTLKPPGTFDPVTAANSDHGSNNSNGCDDDDDDVSAVEPSVPVGWLALLLHVREVLGQFLEAKPCYSVEDF